MSNPESPIIVHVEKRPDGCFETAAKMIAWFIIGCVLLVLLAALAWIGWVMWG